MSSHSVNYLKETQSPIGFNSLYTLMKYNIALWYDHIFATQTNKALFVSFAEGETETVRIQMVFLAIKRFIQRRVSPLYAIIVSTRLVGIMPSTAYPSLFDICQTPSWSYAMVLLILQNTYVRSFLSQDTKKGICWVCECLNIWDLASWHFGSAS
jgi:hypothetical protein